MTNRNMKQRLAKRLTVCLMAGLISLLSIETTSAQQNRSTQNRNPQPRAQNRDAQNRAAQEERDDQTRTQDRRASGRTELPDIKWDTTPLPQDVKARTSFAPIVRKVAPSVVNVYSTRTARAPSQIPFFNDPMFRRFFGDEGEMPGGTPRMRPQQGLGSGVIVSEDGYIITNNHVIEDASNIRVVLVGGEEYPATIVGTDPATDIAVLRVDRTGLPAITLADSTMLDVGDTVLAVGNPFGVGQTVTVGIISGLGRAGFGIVDYEDFIQTDASINPGNSGGALTDVLGRLVGVNTAILSRTGGNQGVGFAVPVNQVRNVMEQIIQYGGVTRGYLGVYIQPLTQELARAFDIEQTKGALVSSVTPRSPAAEAGLQEGDVITEFNDNPVTDSRQLRLMVSQTPPNTRANLSYLRNGREHEATVMLGELPTEQLTAQGRSAPGTRSGGGAFLQGLQVAEIDAQARRQYNLANDVTGLVITEVEPGSVAEREGLQPGDVIEEVNRQNVRTLRDATRNLRDSTQEGSVLLRVRSGAGSRYVVIETGGDNRSQTQPAPERRRSR